MFSQRVAKVVCNVSAGLALALEVVGYQERILLIVASLDELAPELPERGAINSRYALLRSCFCSHALDEHAYRHARRKSVRVEKNVRRHSVLGKWHICSWPQSAHDALLAMARGKLITDHRISGISQLD